ncbi:hypothetical protein LCM19_13060 [Qipengyuania flava]|nr:hypothetical protein [Qipengyuania flava]
MLILTTTAAINDAIARYPAHLPTEALQRYAALLETEPIAWLFILQQGDTADALQRLRGKPFATWEFIDRTDGWFEAVFVISDDGFGHVVLLRDQPDSDPQLLETCRTFATIGE